ncbi:MAG: hypothetical protein IT204_23535 [Fimbriimonadaceae bacterium]|nr:hypothetical protein [Fimbriimonadaceae bacterium]
MWRLTLVLTLCSPLAALPPEVGGVYPSLAMYNQEGECGTGAVVPWAGRLWVITYGPHSPLGSSDKLYEVDAALQQTVRPESVGGTHANRLVHRETQQLLLGRYAIDAQRAVRVIPPAAMPGRLTGTARHLQRPAELVYYGTMEEGLYEVDVRTLAVKRLFTDGNFTSQKAGALLPGYHGKGLFTAQGRVIYANNGEVGPAALTRPETPSGCLASFDGRTWQTILRNQFTEVSGPGGLRGNDSADDPLWSIGWDHRSLLLMLLDGGRWHRFRLPKASHCYDGAHGWNTEWPRIREIGERDLLLTMHGQFWRLPAGFRAGHTGGLAPRSTYLKVVGDFCRWGDRVVLGCDDTAKNEFLNTRAAKGRIAGPGQSHSNLWFVDPARLDQLGPPLGRGAVWLQDDVARGAVSDPFLLHGFDRGCLHLTHRGSQPVELALEVDASGDGRWQRWHHLTLPPGGYRALPTPRATWARLRCETAAQGLTAQFMLSAQDRRSAALDPLFEPLARPTEPWVGGLVRARGENLRTLQYVSQQPAGEGVTTTGNYELTADLQLRPLADPTAQQWLQEQVAIPVGVVQHDGASLLFVDDDGARWRLPRVSGQPLQPAVPLRVCREVCTERDLFSAGGLFYELPARNAGGFAKVRPIAGSDRLVHDYCSYRGMLVLTGLRPGVRHSRVVPTPDGRAGLWVGVADELWRLGKPRGVGGPWLDTPVRAGEPSDPYLLTGFDRRRVALRHDGRQAVRMALEVDLSGTGLWQVYRAPLVRPGQTWRHTLPAWFSAYWLRCRADQDVRATAQLVYD